jgi:hypothetical protein
MLRARLTHAASVGVIAGVSAYAESPSSHSAPLRALIVGALVAGLSGGAGAVIRWRTETKLPAEDVGAVLERMAGIERQLHKLTNIVTALKLESDLRAERHGRS